MDDEIPEKCFNGISFLKIDPRDLTLLKECLKGDPNIWYTRAFTRITQFLHELLVTIRTKPYAGTAAGFSIAYSLNVEYYVDTITQAHEHIQHCFDILNAMMEDPEISPHLFVDLAAKKEAARKLEEEKQKVFLENLERLRKEAEEKRIHDEEERVRKEAEEQHRRAEAERLRKEAEEQHRRAEAERLRKEAEENRIRIEEEKNRAAEEDLGALQIAIAEYDSTQTYIVKKGVVQKIAAALQTVNNNNYITKDAKGNISKSISSLKEDFEKHKKDVEEALNQAKIFTRTLEAIRSAGDKWLKLQKLNTDIDTYVEKYTMMHPTEDISVVMNEIRQKIKVDIDHLREEVLTQARENATGFANKLKVQIDNVNDRMKYLRELKTSVVDHVNKLVDMYPQWKEIIDGYFTKVQQDIENKLKETEQESDPYYAQRNELENLYDEFKKKTVSDKESKEVFYPIFDKALKKLKEEWNDNSYQHTKAFLIKVLSTNVNTDQLHKFAKYYVKYAGIPGKRVKNKPKADAFANLEQSLGTTDHDRKTVSSFMNMIENSDSDYNIQAKIDAIIQMMKGKSEDPQNPLTYPYIKGVYEKLYNQTYDNAVKGLAKNLEKYKADSDYIRGVDDIMQKHIKIYNGLSKLKDLHLSSFMTEADKRDLKTYATKIGSYLESDKYNAIKQSIKTVFSGNQINTLTYNQPLDIIPDNYAKYIQDLEAILKAITPVTQPKDPSIATPTGIQRGTLRRGGALNSLLPILNTSLVSIALLALSMVVAETVQRKCTLSPQLCKATTFYASYTLLLLLLAHALDLPMNFVITQLTALYIFFAALATISYILPQYAEKLFSSHAMALSWAVAMFWSLLVATI